MSYACPVLTTQNLPYDVLSRAIRTRTDLKPGDKLLLLTLQEHGRKSRRCTASNDTLATGTAVSVSGVKRSLKRLEAAGLIRVDSEANATGRAIVLLWLDDPALHPAPKADGPRSKLTSAPVKVDRPPSRLSRPKANLSLGPVQIEPPPPVQIEPHSITNSQSITNSSSKAPARRDDGDEVPRIPIKGHPETVAHAQALFGPEFGRIVAAAGCDLGKTLGGRFDLYRAAMDKAKRRAAPVDNLYAWCLTVARNDLKSPSGGALPAPFKFTPAAAAESSVPYSQRQGDPRQPPPYVFTPSKHDALPKRFKSALTPDQMARLAATGSIR